MRLPAGREPLPCSSNRSATPATTSPTVTDIGLLTASHDAILQRAAEEVYVVVTADSDFPMMLATGRASKPAVTLLRHVTELPCHQHVDLLIANLPTIANDLKRSAIASLSATRLTVLPCV